MNDFINDPSMLDESISEVDYFDLTEYTKSFSQKLDKLNSSSMIGVIADYGKGKSTFIKQVENYRKNSEETWLEFEAWKTPGRKDLWETFVIDLARQIDKEAFNSVIKQLNGTDKEDRKLGINTIVDITKFMTAGVINLDFLNNLNYFINTSPARRVFEIQEILKNVINHFQGEKLFIVVEDVDRSGENGIYFIETLKQFIREVGPELGKKLFIILPISETSFLRFEESYLKCLDVVEFFDYPEKNYVDFFKKLIKEEFISEKIAKDISDFFILLSRENKETTMRKIKLILRKAQISYKILFEEGYNPDWRVCVVIEASRYFRNSRGESKLNEYIRVGNIEKASCYGLFLYSISKHGSGLNIIPARNGDRFNPAPFDWKFEETPDDRINSSAPIVTSRSAIVFDFYIRH
jgi:hypothetical protein